jgi:hypothetical protein
MKELNFGLLPSATYGYLLRVTRQNVVQAPKKPLGLFELFVGSSFGWPAKIAWLT